jgi:hypothetical protein
VSLSILASVLALAAAAAPSGRPAIFSGVVSDSECGLRHDTMRKKHAIATDAACVRYCVDRLKEELVLADHTTGEVYQLDGRKLARRWANRLVRVLGTLDPESGTIRVVRIEAVR